MERFRGASAAIAAILMLPGTAVLAQDAEDVQEMVRVSVDGDIVEMTIEQAAEACDIDVETLRADQAALEAGEGDPVSPDDAGAVDGAEEVAADAPDAASEGEADAMASADVADGAEAEAADAAGEEMAAAEDSAPQADTPDTAVVDNAELEAAADPEVPLPTAAAVCEIDRVRAEELDLVAPD